MCQDCWKHHGSPRRDKLPPEYRRFVYLYDRIYEQNAAGSPLHAVLDDWNIEDEHLHVYPVDDEPAEIEMGEEIVAMMRGWTLIQRAAALGLAEEYF